MKKMIGVLIGMLGVIVWVGMGCTPGYYALQGNTQAATPEQAVQNAENYLTYYPDWRVDCSHFVLACYHSQKIQHYLEHLRGNYNLVRDLNIYLTRQGTRRAHASDIRPGDILIFNETYDINHDGHINDKDRYTHTGIVESYKDGLVTYIDASEDRRPPRIHRRYFSFFDPRENPTVARDPATGRRIHALETFYAAYAVR